MTRKRDRLSDQIRRQIDAVGAPRNAIARAAGIDKGLMSRFMAGKAGLSVASLDALADLLGLGIVKSGPRREIPTRPAGRPKKEGRP